MNLQYLQLSYNMFHGDIPNSITNLDSVRFLNLAGNNISGSIPQHLINLTSMTLKRPMRTEVGWYQDVIGKYMYPWKFFLK